MKISSLNTSVRNMKFSKTTEKVLSIFSLKKNKRVMHDFSRKCSYCLKATQLLKGLSSFSVELLSRKSINKEFNTFGKIIIITNSGIFKRIMIQIFLVPIAHNFFYVKLTGLIG